MAGQVAETSRLLADVATLTAKHHAMGGGSIDVARHRGARWLPMQPGLKSPMAAIGASLAVMAADVPPAGCHRCYFGSQRNRESDDGCHQAPPRGIMSLRGVEDAIMPFSISAAMLSSQMIVTVADRVPQFDTGPSCRESTVPDCLSMEKFAQDKLIKDWPTFTAQDRAMCVMEEKMSGPPSYVGWLTCLEINANARNAEANAANSSAPAATTGGAGLRPHGRIRRRQ